MCAYNKTISWTNLRIKARTYLLAPSVKCDIHVFFFFFLFK